MRSGRGLHANKASVRGLYIPLGIFNNCHCGLIGLSCFLPFLFVTCVLYILSGLTVVFLLVREHCFQKLKDENPKYELHAGRDMLVYSCFRVLRSQGHELRGILTP